MKNKIDKLLLTIICIVALISIIFLLVEQYKTTIITLDQTTVVEDKYVEFKKSRYECDVVCESKTYKFKTYLVDEAVFDELSKNDKLTLNIYDGRIVQISKDDRCIYSYETFNAKANKQFSMSIIIILIFIISMAVIITIPVLIIKHKSRKRSYDGKYEVEENVDLDSIDKNEYDRLMSSIKKNGNIYEGDFFGTLQDQNLVSTFVKVLIDYFKEDEFNLLVDSNEDNIAIAIYILDGRISIEIVMKAKTSKYVVSKDLIWYYPSCETLPEDNKKYISAVKLYSFKNFDISLE